MDPQSLINILFGLVAFFGGIWVRGIADSLKELKQVDTELASKMQSIEVLIAGDYIKRDDFHDFTKELFGKLAKIEEKLDRKVDK